MNASRKLLRKVIDFFYRMSGLNDILFGTERDKVARASFSTYSPQELARLGLEITFNPSNNKARFVGNPPVYPDIVVWRPDYQGSNTGQAVIVEDIETTGTLAFPRTNDWLILSRLAGTRFNLIVPQASLPQVRQILTANNIANVHLQTWTHNVVDNRYIFNTQV